MVCTESTTTSGWAAPRRCGRARSADPIPRRGRPRRGCSRCVSARIRIWPADSSPDRYSARRPASAQRCATSSSSVDLPTPGSPASSVTEPGTRPPPSTRSSSLTPVWKCRVRPGSIELIGTAARTWERPPGARPNRPTADEHSDLVDRAPGAAVRAAADPLGGDVVALRTAVLRTRLGPPWPRSDGIRRDRQNGRSSVRTSCRRSARARRRVARFVTSRRGVSPAEIGTGTVASPAFSNVKVKSYVSPLVIGLVSCHRRLGGVGGLDALQRRRSARRASPTTSTPLAGSAVSPVSVTVPTSEVIDVSLSAMSGEVVGRHEDQLDLAARLDVVGRLRGPQVHVAQRDRAEVRRWCR